MMIRNNKQLLPLQAPGHPNKGKKSKKYLVLGTQQLMLTRLCSSGPSLMMLRSIESTGIEVTMRQDSYSS